DSDAIFRSIEHWFGDIPSNGEAALPVPHKFLNYQGSSIRLDQDVPVRTFYLIFPMSSRQSKAYYAFDLLSDVLASGRSALLYSSLVKEKALLTQVDAYITGTTESGLFIIEGQLAVGVTFDEVYTQVWGELDTMRNGMMNQVLFEKLINTVETNLALSETSVLHKGMSLAYFEALGDANGINEEVDRYRDISKDMLVEIVGLYLNPNMATKVEYHPITKA
ncbi:MAG: insulinase family protein, partial [Saprospiraceae bacterium]|nr:insulinase family protein [Saprospiraceae bacterium]